MELSVMKEVLTSWWWDGSARYGRAFGKVGVETHVQ